MSRFSSSVCTFLAVLACSLRLWCAPVMIAALPEHLRPDPFGEVVPADRIESSAELQNPAASILLQAARGGYASCHLVLRLPPKAEYRLEIAPPSSGTRIEPALFREWFHFLPATSQYYPDALVPIPLPYHASFPDPGNLIPNQTAQAFWLDLWIPADARPGDYLITANVRLRDRTASLPIHLKVLSPVVPAEDVLFIDHNSYGTSWFAAQYPALCKRPGPAFFNSSGFFALIHSYHRIFYEHRGTFHQLGYGHAGKVGPEFAPGLAGRGITRHVASWELYDKHYGPLLNGSAFAETHRGPRAIPFVYLPINPEWPATFESWGEPGYEREFVQVVSEMERHFRQKGWSHTNFELFFNQKKRYRGFNWDGDEARFAKDYSYPREYARLLKLAVPADSPVKFVFRADVSWTMERQWRELAGVVNFWVCGGGMFSWFPDAALMLKSRGDIVWTYGGTPPVTEPSSHITLDVVRAWMQGVAGFVRWETTAPGPDPWFHFAGGTENLVYPGDRFGIPGPIPSIRLKIERNAIEGVTLLEAVSRRSGPARLRQGAAKAFNQTAPADWWTSRPPLADTNPEDWSNADIEEASPTPPAFAGRLDSAAWPRLRNYILEAAQEQQ